VQLVGKERVEVRRRRSEHIDMQMTVVYIIERGFESLLTCASGCDGVEYGSSQLMCDSELLR